MAELKKVYRNKKGEKLYPVGKWETNQHKIYNYHDRCMNALDDACQDKNVSSAQIEELERQVERSNELLESFESYVIDGMVYATYEDYKELKDIRIL